MKEKISIKNGEYYIWGNNCEGWHLLKNENLSIIQEKVPPGKSEIKHYHNKSRQFFFILEGEGTIEIYNREIKLTKHEGLEIEPGQTHNFKNISDKEVTFLVISSPESHGDRINLE